MLRGQGRTGPVKGTLILSVQSVILHMMGMLFYMYLARLLPLSEIGVLSLMIFMFTLFSLPQLALPTAAIRFIATSVGRGDDDSASEVASSVLITVISLTLLFTLAGYLVTPHLSLPFPDHMVLLVLVAGLLGSLFSAFSSFLQGFEQFLAVAAISLVTFVLSRLLGITMIYLGLGLTGVVYGWILAFSLGIVATIRELRSRTTLGLVFTIHQLRALLSYSLPLWVFTTIGLLFHYLDRVLFYMQAGDLYQLGIYDLSLRASLSLSVIYGPLSSVTLPFFSRRLVDIEVRLENPVSLCLRYLSLLLVPAAFGLSAASPTVFRVFYGRDTPLGVQLLLILASTSIVQGFSALFQSILQAQARTLLFLKIGVTSLLVEVFLIYLLTPQIGVFGIALARSGMYISLCFLSYWAARSTMNIRFPPKKTLLRILLTSAVVYLVTALTENLLKIPPLPKFIVQILLGSISFSASIILLHTLNQEDQKMLERILPERAKPLLMKLKDVTDTS